MILSRTTLNNGWRFIERRWLKAPGKLRFSTVEWLPATVPGHVHADLVQNGVIADPHENLGELGAQWVDDADWVYACQFEWTPRDDGDRRVIRFNGLDTVCTVSLNGDEVARHDNMFVPLELDVTTLLRQGTNELRVTFESAVRVGNERRRGYFDQEGLPEHTERFDERAFVRKAPYMFGWDWGPRLVSAGIWRDVTLLEYAARLVDVHVEQRHSDAGRVEIRIQSTTEGSGALFHEVAGVGEVSEGCWTEIPSPQVWWPAGMGDQPLYTLSTRLQEGTRLLDARETRFGLRTFRIIQESDAYGRSFQFEVNGRRMWSVGANWIPDHTYPSRVSPKREREQLAKARDMNMNVIRIWGGGVYESDSFYDACDELGLLVWQDFPFACNYAPDDEAACSVMAHEAAENIRRLRNHPSLALWCGNNENRIMWDLKWGEADKHPPRYFGEHIWDETLPAQLAQWDPGRPYLTSSPIGGANANDDAVGDQHNWDVWHGRGDWVHYAESRGRYISEFGFAAAPSPAAVAKMFGAPNAEALDRRSVDDRVARWHDKTAKGYDTFKGYVALHYPESADLGQWVYFSQLNQRDALRFGIEHYRRSEFCAGTLIWQLNDCWPVQSWAVLDSEGAYKAAAYELRRLFAPALVSLAFEADALVVVIICDNQREPACGLVTLTIRDTMTGETLDEWKDEVAVPSGSRVEVHRRPTAAYDARTISITADFAGVSTTRFLAEPKALALPRPRLEATLTETSLTIHSTTPVFDLMLREDSGALGFGNNFVSLPAGGSLTLPCTRRGGGLRPELFARYRDGLLPVALR